MKRDKIAGTLFGMAIGDSTGSVTEFMKMEQINARFPPGLPPEPIGNPALVTDDTQMALAVGEALVETGNHLTPETFGENLREKFVHWLHSPDNTRAPGNTCLRACRNLADDLPWYKATVMGSKGCGANMRVQPVGLMNVMPETRAKIAQLQAAYTHAHPTALTAADITAFVIAMLAEGSEPDTIINNCREYAASQREIYHADWLGDLWRRYPTFGQPSADIAYISRGWDQVLDVLERIENAPRHLDRMDDPCEHTGADWTAEEAFATALYCFLLYPDDATAVVQRTAFTRGDSDSISAIAGAFAGAYLGISSWNLDWVKRIEYHDRISALVDSL